MTTERLLALVRQRADVEAEGENVTEAIAMCHVVGDVDGLERYLRDPTAIAARRTR